MTIVEACRSILGSVTANAIIADQGVHWAVVAAMAKARTTDDPTALAAIDKWRSQHRMSARETSSCSPTQKASAMTPLEKAAPSQEALALAISIRCNKVAFKEFDYSDETAASAIDRFAEQRIEAALSNPDEAVVETMLEVWYVSLAGNKGNPRGESNKAMRAALIAAKDAILKERKG